MEINNPALVYEPIFLETNHLSMTDLPLIRGNFHEEFLRGIPTRNLVYLS